MSFAGGFVVAIFLLLVASSSGCATNDDCRQSSCCHSTDCVDVSKASGPNCTDVMCSGGCHMKTLDCGGECRCNEKSKTCFPYIRVGMPPEGAGQWMSGNHNNPPQPKTKYVIVRGPNKPNTKKN